MPFSFGESYALPGWEINHISLLGESGMLPTIANQVLAHGLVQESTGLADFFYRPEARRALDFVVMVPLPDFAGDARHWRQMSREAAKRSVADAKQRIRSCRENIETSKKLIEYCKAEMQAAKAKR